MGEFNTLRKPRRARCIELVTGLVLAAANMRIDRLVLREPIVIACEFSGLANHENTLDRLELHLCKMPEKLLADHEDTRLRVIEDVFDLGRCETPVHGERHGIDHRCAE